jgi:hypothetical protein
MERLVDTENPEEGGFIKKTEERRHVNIKDVEFNQR